MAKKKRAKSIKDIDPLTHEQKHELLKKLTKEQVMAAVDFIAGDGHSIFAEDSLLQRGWPAETARSVCREFSSDLSDPKATIFDGEGKVMKKLYGWYGLDVLSCLAHSLNVSYEGCIGRGFQARAIDKAIREHFQCARKD
jgi:hypothetical protein